MDKKQMKQYAPAMIVIGVILLLVTGYQAFNPVMAVSAHDDRSDVRSMLAITTFEVTPTPRDPPCYAPDGLGYGDIDGDGKVTNDDALYITRYVIFGQTSYPMTPEQLIRADVNLGGISSSDGWVVSKYAAYVVGYDSFLVCTASPAQIDDSTDTLTTDETTYNPGDTVSMTAWGENVGEQAWSGRVEFSVTAPFDSLVAQETDVTVAAGSSYSATGSWTIPTDATTGTYTLQSKWIDDAGTVHAMSTIDLGTETIWGMDINVLGALGSILGVLLLIGGLMYRKK